MDKVAKDPKKIIIPVAIVLVIAFIIISNYNAHHYTAMAMVTECNRYNVVFSHLSTNGATIVVKGFFEDEYEVGKWYKIYVDNNGTPDIIGDDEITKAVLKENYELPPIKFKESN